MRSITAVEIGADTCALASTSVQGPDVRVAAAETLDPASFPGMDAFTLALQQTRRALKLPRRCRAVVWGLPDGASRKDPIVGPLIEPLTRAGFRVARVVTPCNALGALARLRTSRTGGAMCWLGINRNGVAIVVIRPGKLLYSHSFAWDSSVGASGSQARLLQRYSLVAFLAPEVRRAIAAAKQKGTTVDGIVTCGNLPDLRALTMPLIEELDIEVETLDSLEGLTMKPELADKLSEVAPAIRLACAGAFARETRTVDEAKRRRVRQNTRAAVVLRVAALLAAIGAGAYGWYLYRHASARKPVFASSAAPRSMPGKPAAAVIASAAKPSTPAPSGTTPAPTVITPKNTTATATKSEPPVISTTTKPVAPPASAPASAPPANASMAKPPIAPTRIGNQPAAVTPPARGNTPAAAPPARAPISQPSTAAGATSNPGPIVSTPAAPVRQPPPQTRIPADKPASLPSAPALSRPPVTHTQAEVPALHPPPVAADKSGAASAGKPLPELLKDPVPKVTAILVSADRRLATVGDEGQIIGVGDTIGRRVVVAIDDRTVLLREPSGVQIRVALGGRVVGVERSDR